MNGSKLSKNIEDKLSIRVKELHNINIFPCLAVIQIGNNKSSNIYIKNKRIVANRIGITFKLFHLDNNINTEKVIKLIKKLNLNVNVTGIMVQLPLPRQFDTYKIINTINPQKDVDSLTAYNIGNLWLDKHCYYPSTALGIVRLLHEYNVKISGKNVVIIGRSNIVGKPLAAMLLKENATVTIAHSKTSELKKITKEADILIVAIGKKNFINSKYVKPQSTIIDVGINYNMKGKLVGDVDFNDVKTIVKMITPVPRGVGPMTIISLLEQVISASEKCAFSRLDNSKS